MVPRKFRLIPLEVEAEKLTPETVRDLVLWCKGLQVEETDPFDDAKKYVAINVPTRHGMKRASEGSYIVMSILTKEFTVMDAPEFESTHEAA